MHPWHLPQLNWQIFHQLSKTEHHLEN
jgi:hypothetical protein